MKKILVLTFLLATFFAHAQTTVWSDNFNDENINDWTLIDADGDGFNWQTIQMLGGWPPSPIGTPFLSSVSYTQYNNIGNVFPDNWAISPMIDLSAISQGQVINLNWAIVDSAYSWNPQPNNENYAIYIAGSIDTVAFIAGGIKYTERNTPEPYTMRTLDISEYAGQQIYIAFRHYDVSDSIQVPFSSSLEFDDMSVTIGGTSISSEYGPGFHLSLHPNPADVSFHFNIPANFNALTTKVEIQDLTGRVVVNYNKVSENIDVTDLLSGLYFVVVSDGTRKVMGKLIKK